MNEEQTQSVCGESPVGYDGSMQRLLAQNLGCYAACDFLIGTSELRHLEGVLHAVGASWLCLADPASAESDDSYTICDIYCLKFARLWQPGTLPPLCGD